MIQADAFNRSQIGTVVVVAITSNLELGPAPGNLILSRRDSKLPRKSVINVSQVLTLERRFLVKRVTRLPGRFMENIEDGIRLVLSL